jgi:hypothetical protein
MWTEVATGAEARSVRRWLGRAVLQRALPWLVILAVIVAALVVYEETRPWRPSDCENWGAEFISKSDIPPGYHYAETGWGSFVMCNDPP